MRANNSSLKKFNRDISDEDIKHMSTLEVEKMRANAKLREEKARLVHLRQQEHSQGLKKVQEVWVPLTAAHYPCRN